MPCACHEDLFLGRRELGVLARGLAIIAFVVSVWKAMRLVLLAVINANWAAAWAFIIVVMRVLMSPMDVPLVVGPFSNLAICAGPVFPCPCV
jgi:hypothetical protein